MAIPEPINVSGFDNLFENGVENIVKLIHENKSSIKVNLADIYDDDILLPATPSVAVMFDSATPNLRAAHLTSRRRYTYDIRFDVWYYHSELNENVKRKHVTEIAWQLFEIFQINNTLHGFVSKLGSNVEVIRYRPRLRSGKIFAAALIGIVAHKICTLINTS